MNDIDKLKKNKTLIIIAHRLVTVEKTDHLIKIESGEIIKQGKPEEVLNK